MSYYVSSISFTGSGVDVDENEEAEEAEKEKDEKDHPVSERVRFVRRAVSFEFPFPHYI